MLNGEKEVACPNCNGACCFNTKMPLNTSEVQFMEKGGTRLQPVFSSSVEDDVEQILKGVQDSTLVSTVWDALAARDLAPDEGLYRLNGVCGYLVKRDGWWQCAENGNPNRPRRCGDFKTGSPTCVNFFKERSSVNVELMKKPQKQ